MAVQVPEWVKHAVFYQIFPDRFARSSRNTLPRGLALKPWGTPPEEQGFQGGDLYGIVDKLDYLQELGITALYLNPIFASASNHRYHTYNYFAVDPLLGGNAALRELVDALHDRGMRIVLDGVFNHASRGFWPFHHVLETGSDSPYLDWFYVDDWPLIPYPPDDQTPINYAAWWGIPALPKLNVANPGMRDYLLEVAAYWIDFGVDGWRLDVAEEIKDATFWQEFRRVTRQANPESYSVGEIWHEAPEWLRGDRFDAVMNYVLSRAAYGFFGATTLNATYRPGGFPLYPMRAKEFAQAVEETLSLYDWEIVQVQLNLMDSHDTARTLWVVNGDMSALHLCTLFQMTMPGAPCIYYGTEIGMTGATDPYCRAAFPWYEPDQWDYELLAFFKEAVALRHAHPVLRTGSVRTLYADHGVYACMRESDGEEAGEAAAVVIFNTRMTPLKVNLNQVGAHYEGVVFQSAWRGEGEYVVSQGGLHNVEVPARDAVVLVC
jgi:cyclomaltodextrinase / maltogenic alpha-amylase / neopullulanase